MAPSAFFKFLLKKKKKKMTTTNVQPREAIMLAICMFSYRLLHLVLIGKQEIAMNTSPLGEICNFYFLTICYNHDIANKMCYMPSSQNKTVS